MYFVRKQIKAVAIIKGGVFYHYQIENIQIVALRYGHQHGCRGPVQVTGARVGNG
jgi:hypothetical protein